MARARERATPKETVDEQRAKLVDFERRKDAIVKAAKETPMVNRRMVEQLLRELSSRLSYNRNSSGLDEAVAAVDAREEMLKREDPEYNRLKQVRDDLDKKNRVRYNKARTKIQAVRDKYLANGPTPAVLAKLNDLVDFLHEEDNDGERQ